MDLSWGLSRFLSGPRFMFANPKLFQPVVLGLCCTFVTVIITIVVMFAVALYPQAYALEFKAGLATWLSWCLAVLFTLIEICIIVLILTSVIISYPKKRLFEMTLELKGLTCAEISGGKRRDAKCCEISELPTSIFILIVTMPLHFIPVIGSSKLRSFKKVMQ